MWADTFHAGLRNGTETSALIAAARAANCNAVIVEVRRRGDAYYRNGLEPVATDVAPGFDPLADLIQKGHGGTPRIEVHAWIVAYNIWNDEDDPPPQPTHPFNLHPDWLNETNTGQQWTGSPGTSGNYLFDPGHPGVQQHTFNVAMDIISRYDIDGFHFDYIRYPEYFSSGNNQPWGYNPVTVARYKKLKNVTATPAPTNAAWLQWRREQVTALVRKVYLNAWALKPNVRISAALIPWGNPPTLTLTSWQSTEAYARVLQDWRGWMEEGILDLACPMVYRNEATTPGFDGWGDFTKDRQYNRAAAIGMGWYLNSIQNTILQIKNTRTASPGGRFASGLVGYSYAVPNRDGIAGSQVWDAFTDDAAAEVYDPGGTPVFANIVGTPAMPWKSNGTKGHIIGYVREDLGTTGMDGLTVTITGPGVTRTLTTDASGFFGAADLPPGNYTVSVSSLGYRPDSESCPVVAGLVTQRTLRLESVPLTINSVVRSPTANTLTINWNSKPGRTYRIEGSNNLLQWSIIASQVAATGTSTTYQWSIPAAWSAQAFLRVAQEP